MIQLLFTCLFCFVPTLPTQQQKASARATKKIQQILDKQQKDWNEGDIPAFMEAYWQSDDLTFSSGGSTTRGWQTTKERYLSRYSSAELMGKLTFSDIQTSLLSPKTALTLGKWSLHREKPMGGNFSLVWRKLETGWKIVHDHTSLLREDSEDSPKNEQRPTGLPANINDNFLDPGMNVEDFINRFEIESREVFACREQILASLDIKPGMAIADIGAGTGLYMKAFSRSVAENGKVFAVDISPNFIKHLRQRAKEEELNNVEVVLCSDRDANLKPNSIDRAFICDVYHHFEFPNSSMSSIYRALKPGGELVLVDFDRVEGKTREWLMNHIRAPKEVFRREIEEVGFKFDREVKVDGFEENYLLRFTK